MLNTSPEPGAEEWAVHDYEGFGDIDLCEWPDIERVSVIARLLFEHGEAFAVWHSTQDADNFATDKLAEKFTEQWQGAHDTESDFASQLLEDCGNLSELPDWAKNLFRL